MWNIPGLGAWTSEFQIRQSIAYYVEYLRTMCLFNRSVYEYSVIDLSVIDLSVIDLSVIDRGSQPVEYVRSSVTAVSRSCMFHSLFTDAAKTLHSSAADSTTATASLPVSLVF